MTTKKKIEIEPMRTFVLLAVKEIRRLGDSHNVLGHPRMAAAMKNAHNTELSPESLEKDLRDVIGSISDEMIFDILHQQTFSHWKNVISPSVSGTKRSARAFCNVFNVDRLGVEYSVLIETIFGREEEVGNNGGSDENVIAGRRYVPNKTANEGCQLTEEDLKRLAVLLSKLVESAIIYVHRRRGPQVREGQKGYTMNFKMDEIKTAYWAQQFNPPLTLPWPTAE